jgi:hypothetical protein
LFQRMSDTPITLGLFSLLLASAVVGLLVRATRRSTRVTFTGRAIVTHERDYSGVSQSDVEAAIE